jgi:hypothetical protein
MNQDASSGKLTRQPWIIHESRLLQRQGILIKLNKNQKMSFSPEAYLSI